MRNRSFILTAVLLASLCALAGGVWAYDSSRDDLIAAGVRVGGVDLGGLHAPAARAKLHRELLSPLDSTIVVESRAGTFHLTAREARIAGDVDGMVRAAVQRSRSGSILSRTFRGLTGEQLNVELQPRVTFSREAVSRLLARVSSAVHRKARDASVKFTGDGVTKVDARAGVALTKDQLRRQIFAAITTPGAQRHFKARVHRVSPAITTAQLPKLYPTVVTINRGAFRLRLFKKLKLVKTYSIAVGQAGLETPAGLYHVQDRQDHPIWHVPDREWAGKLAGQVIPYGDPRNPIKARWLGIYNGAGIHGTTDDSSIGSAASHGCIRMHIPDVIELYPEVPIQTPVFIA